jgi:hypothetical protein
MDTTNNTLNEPIKKRRGRKKKEETVVSTSSDQNISLHTDDTDMASSADVNENVPKKRGRKPKGGKLVVKNTENNTPQTQVTNVILHLKCSLSDLNQNENSINLLSNPLEYNPMVPPSIVTFNDKETINKYAKYGENVTENNSNTSSDKNAYEAHLTNISTVEPTEHICSRCNGQSADFFDFKSEETTDVNMKDILLKLKNLKLKLYKSANNDKKSACFWCTYEFDNPACYIPKYELNDEMCGYGSFCRPECAEEQ